MNYKMPLLIDHLSVWDIGFRWAAYDPRKLYFRIPLEVENNLRNLMNAILGAELFCLTITLEKRAFAPEEKEYSVYYWLDDIHACIGGVANNKKMLRHALVDRADFAQWCERMNIPLPEFWFPPGWNYSYDLPDDEIHPGHGYLRRDWTREQWAEWMEARNSKKEGSAELGQDTAVLDAPHDNGMRPNQEARIACRQIAKGIWQREPDRTIASVIEDNLIQEYGGAKSYVNDTVREWIKDIAPQQVRDRRGCKNFCVNGHLAGDCRYLVRSCNDRTTQSTTHRTDRRPVGRLSEA